MDKEWPMWRRALSGFGNLYARMVLRVPCRDLTTGFRLWRSETLAGMPLDRMLSNGYVFTVEMIYLAHCLQYRIAEIPVHFTERRHGKSKMSVAIQAEAALRIWQVRWHYRDLRRLGKKARVSIERRPAAA